jgi:hypothetical protein
VQHKNIEITQKKKKKKKKTYELNMHFQANWAIKLPWVKFVLGFDGKVVQTECKICK